MCKLQGACYKDNVLCFCGHFHLVVSFALMVQVVGDVALQLHSGEIFTGIEFVN